MPTNETVVQITAPRTPKRGGFCAGIVAVDGKVVEAAPIVKYMLGWSGPKMVAYCKKKGWTYRRL